MNFNFDRIAMLMIGHFILSPTLVIIIVTAIILTNMIIATIGARLYMA